MGPLIYETVDGVVYAREFGSDERIVVGYTSESAKVRIEVEKETQEWIQILEASKSNKALQSLVDQCKIVYRLGVEHGEK